VCDQGSGALGCLRGGGEGAGIQRYQGGNARLCWGQLFGGNSLVGEYWERGGRATSRYLLVVVPTVNFNPAAAAA
jgi:hypothetical protein